MPAPVSTFFEQIKIKASKQAVWNVLADIVRFAGGILTPHYHLQQRHRWRGDSTQAFESHRISKASGKRAVCKVDREIDPARSELEKSRTADPEGVVKLISGHRNPAVKELLDFFVNAAGITYQ